ncbi:MAG: carboxypeptidase M32, partial [Gemmatimonadaceae bacterium]
MTPEDAYAEVVRLSRDESVLSSCYELLQWDAEIYMPRDGVAHRSDQMGLVAGLVHDRATNPRYEELLSTIEASSLVSDPETPAAVNVREIRRDFDRERRKPRRLVEEWASVTALASQAWAEARTNDDFKAFAPWIERIFALAREKADAVGWVGERYDGLLEDFEPGMTTDQIVPMFAKLEADLVPLVASLREQSPPAADDVLTREFPVEGQRVFDEAVATAIGFNMESGRLDIAQHPFCTMIGPG